MKIGLFSDGLPDLSFTEFLDWSVQQGIGAVEIGTGGFSSATHCDLDGLLADEGARQEFTGAIESRGLKLSALNINSNPLDPDAARGKRDSEALFKTIELAGRIGLGTVVTMSGCPGDPSGGAYPNWVTHPWQLEFHDLYEWQWQEVVTPFWKKVGSYAAERRVNVAIEMHPGQMVYNTTTMLRLREIGGANIGANFDPSHLFYQGMDPLRVIGALGEDFIFHVHAKDTRVDPHEMALNGVVDMRSFENLAERTWAYRTLGFGHDARWWKEFVSALRQVGYDGVLSIEHEDLLMSAEEGIVKSVEFLRPIAITTQPETEPSWFKRE